MGARPSSFKKGGGFLNNVDGVFSDYNFTDTFPGATAQKNSKSDFNPLYATVTFDVDGNSDPQSTTLLVGSADDFEISEDGKTLTPVDDKISLRSNTPWAKFIGSACDRGFPETSLPDDGEPINYESMLGTRLRLVQETDEEGMAKAAKNYRKSNGKFNEQGQKKGKDGKYYNLTVLVVGEIYALPGAKASTTKAPAGKTAAKAAPAAGKQKKSNDGDALNELAKETLLAILADNDNSIAKSKLPAKIAQKLGVKHPQREEVRKLIYSDDFLATEDGWSYDQSSKTQTITATE